MNIRVSKNYTGNQIKKICLGSAQFGMVYGISNNFGKTDKHEINQILSYSREKGIDLIDTAIAYGDAEEVLGHCDIDSFKFVSKFMIPSDLTVTEQIQLTLKNLKKKKLYGYLAHRPRSILTKPQLWSELEDLKKSGLVEKIGFSLDDPNELKEINDKKFIPDIIQVPYNYLDQRFEKMIIHLHNEGCEIHARSVFLQGLFFRDPDSLPAYFDEIKSFLFEFRNSVKNPAGSLLQFVIEKDFIDRVIIGVETKNQLSDCIKGLIIGSELPKRPGIIPSKIIKPSSWSIN